MIFFDILILFVSGIGFISVYCIRIRLFYCTLYLFYLFYAIFFCLSNCGWNLRSHRLEENFGSNKGLFEKNKLLMEKEHEKLSQQLMWRHAFLMITDEKAAKTTSDKHYNFNVCPPMVPPHVLIDNHK